jgi:hypothetical protein
MIGNYNEAQWIHELAVWSKAIARVGMFRGSNIFQVTRIPSL